MTTGMTNAVPSWGRHQTFCATSAEIASVLEYFAERLARSGWSCEPWTDAGALAGRGVGGLVASAETGASLSAIVRPAPASSLHLPDERLLTAQAANTVPAEEAFLDQWIERLPLTDTELASAAREMPLTAGIVEALPRWAPTVVARPGYAGKPLAGFGGIFTIHHQTDFLILLERALALGIDQELVTVIDKQYRYRTSARVDATITDSLRIPVFTYDQLLEGAALRDHIRRVGDKMKRLGAATWRRTVIVDDGGYVLPRILGEFARYMNLFVGVVEQTASGIWALQPYEADMRVPVFSVAESDLKQTVEAHGVAMAAVINLRTLLPNIKFTGQRAIVVGYGRIGRALSQVLRSMHLQVVVVDHDRGARVSAAEDGFGTARTVAEAILARQPQFILSCAGRGGVSQEAFDALNGRTYLVSCTSRDYAFDKRYLESGFDAERFGTVGTIYSRRGAELFLVADGFPVNFHHAESMPNAQSDLVMASMLLGAVHLCSADPEWPPGNDPARANFHLNTGTLLDDFYEMHHEVPP
jgi:adenosylhomocysteinase